MALLSKKKTVATKARTIELLLKRYIKQILVFVVKEPIPFTQYTKSLTVGKFKVVLKNFSKVTRYLILFLISD